MRENLVGATWRLAIYLVVCMLGAFALVAVFGQLRFQPEKTYKALFTNVSGLEGGNFVRIAGVDVGKVKNITVQPDSRVLVEFGASDAVVLTEGTRAAIRFADLVGGRYVALEEGAGGTRKLDPGSTIPASRTEPALDLDALIGGFRPLFRALDPQKVNTIASSIITVFQGEGGTINDILDQTAQLTARLAESDQAIGAVIHNLNTVLDTTVRHRDQFDVTIDKFEVLITGLKDRATPLADGTAHISNAAGTVADLLGDNRALVHETVNRLEPLAGPLVDQRGRIGDLVGKVPAAFNIIGR